MLFQQMTVPYQRLKDVSDTNLLSMTEGVVVSPSDIDIDIDTDSR